MSLIREPKRIDTFLGPVGMSMSMVLLNDVFFSMEWLKYCIPALTIATYWAYDKMILLNHRDLIKNEKVHAARILHKELAAIEVDMKKSTTTQEKRIYLSKVYDKTTAAIRNVSNRRFSDIHEIHSIVDKIRIMREE